jgi:hypothetical protein
MSKLEDMPVSICQTIRNAICEDLIQILTEQYGNEWICNFDSNIRRCPYQELATKHGVSVRSVRKIRKQIRDAGLFLRIFYQTAYEQN